VRGGNTQKGKEELFFGEFLAGFGWRAAAVVYWRVPQQLVLSVRGGWGPTATGGGRAMISSSLLPPP